jgi:hypothetical protein
MKALVSLTVCLAGAFVLACFAVTLTWVVLVADLEPETVLPLVTFEAGFLAAAVGAGAGVDEPSVTKRRVLAFAGDSITNSAPAIPNQTLV